ncbi:MAG: DUF4261 domain-containing protein [Lachnospiraceae bacterium]|nr:DUF4261 domain-containing protein [Lachnospiraceae bacterium]
MNEKKAVEIMTKWLSHPNELAKEPAQIRAAGSFSYDGNNYVILRFQPERSGQWQVGVVGFDEAGEECGHTFSEYEEYDEATAKERCIAMIDELKEYWKSRLLADLERMGITEEEYNNMSSEEFQQKWSEAEKQEAMRIGCVLLEDAGIDFDALSGALQKAFHVTVENATRDDGMLVFEQGPNMIAVSLMEAPVRDGEAQFYAQANYLWDKAVDVAKRHRAHLLVMARNAEGNAIETACYFADTVNICCKETGALGIYTTGNVYEPAFYDQWTQTLREHKLPIPIWIYLGLVQDERGNNGYTYGMTAFGRPEIEIVASSRSLQEIYDFMHNVCAWLLAERMYFRDGETLTFAPGQKLTVTKSKAVFVEGESFKIAY